MHTPLAMLIDELVKGKAREKIFETTCDICYNPRMNKEIQEYHHSLAVSDRNICDALFAQIIKDLHEAEYKIWHRHPVWFLDGNPIVGYHKLKDCVRLLFWSGQSFDEKDLKHEGSFKAAAVRYTSADEIDPKDLALWLKKSRDIQWDYKNIIKRKGKLELLK